MSQNPFVRLQRLIPPSPVLIAKVTAQDAATDTSTLQLPTGQGVIPIAGNVSAGSTIRARGRGVAVGKNAFVRDGYVESQAPDGSPVETIVGRVVQFPAALAFVGPIPNQASTVGQALTLDLNSYWTGGFTPYYWTIASGTLPTGLSLNANAGVISGSVSVSTVQRTVSIRCTDNLGATATGSVTFLAS